MEEIGGGGEMFHLIDPVGVCRGETRVGSEPPVDRGACVGAVVVADQMHGQFVRDFGVDLVQELLEFERCQG